MADGGQSEYDSRHERSRRKTTKNVWDRPKTTRISRGGVPETHCVEPRPRRKLQKGRKSAVPTALRRGERRPSRPPCPSSFVAASRPTRALGCIGAELKQISDHTHTATPPSTANTGMSLPIFALAINNKCLHVDNEYYSKGFIPRNTLRMRHEFT